MGPFSIYFVFYVSAFVPCVLIIIISYRDLALLFLVISEQVILIRKEYAFMFEVQWQRQKAYTRTFGVRRREGVPGYQPGFLGVATVVFKINSNMAP